MNKSFERFLALNARERADVFNAAAQRLHTVPLYIEKDFWVCRVLDALYNGLQGKHPQLLFKGGTSLSKAFGLINRFSEDVDISVSRAGLGITGDRDPFTAGNISKNKIEALFEEVAEACATYVQGTLRGSLDSALRAGKADYKVIPEDQEPQNLIVEYASVLQSGSDGDGYVLPRVKIEAGAKSAFDPNSRQTIRPFIAEEMRWSFDVNGVVTIGPDRTMWDKLLILHSYHCRFRDQKYIPGDQNRLSRHYYDAAMILDTGIGNNSLSDRDLATSVREQKKLAFPSGWAKYDEAVPGTLRLVPNGELRNAIEKDYVAMSDMVLGAPPPFEWIIQKLQHAEDDFNEMGS